MPDPLPASDADRPAVEIASPAVDAGGDPVCSRQVRTELRRGYEIVGCPDLEQLTEKLAQGLAGPERGMNLLVTTPTVRGLYGAELAERLRARGVALELFELECSESTKTWAQVERVAEASGSAGLGRRSALVALSGGVASDIVTLAASVIRRGIAHVRVPTTLLAQCDAAVGIKGAVHLDKVKNHLGCFHPPERVLICPEFLGSLPGRQLRSGLGELLKVALAGDSELFEDLERHASDLQDPAWHCAAAEANGLLWRSIEGLLDELEPNLYEDRTLVRSMDLGHTFSPWIESESGFEVLHGEAVGMDMLLCTAIAIELDWIDQGEAERIAALLRSVGLARVFEPLGLPGCRAALAEAVRHRGGELNLFLPVGVGRSACLRTAEPLGEAVLRRSLARAGLWSRER